MANTKHELKVDGMTCSNCALGVQKAIEKSGGQKVNVNFATKQARFEHNEEDITSIKSKIEKLGYEIIDSATDEDQKGWSKVEKLFVFCLVFTLPLFLHMFVGHDHWLNNPWLQISLSVPVLLTGGLYFIKSATSSLKSGVPNMDVLISIGILSAFGYSLWGVLLHGSSPDVHDFLFFETTASITTLVLLGNVIEHRSVQKTTSAIQQLKKLQPTEVKKKKGDRFEKVLISEVNIDDEFKIVDGDRIALDGTVNLGELEVDESMITGESEPVIKKIGDKVLGGTIVLSGNAVVTSTKNVGESALDNIITLVSNAQESKPNIQKTGDRISAIFVPIVLGVSLTTFLVAYFLFDISAQQSLMQSIAVLVISCPCAMGLAAPTAIMVGIGRAAKEGILVKGGDTLEKLSKCNVAIFDKTGTLTTGNFSLKNFVAHEVSEATAKSIILSLEEASNHPIAQSLTRILSKDHQPENMGKIKEIKGEGITGQDYKENEYTLVSNKIAKTKFNKDSEADLILFKNEIIIAELWITDEVKEDAKTMVDALKQNGLRTIMLSGDKNKKCAEVAKILGIDEYYSEKSPEEKLGILDTLFEQEYPLMLGDGINDAPALARSYVGVSFGEATDIAINASDVILTNKKMNALVDAIHIGKLTYTTIKQNFFWALFYNVLAIPVAAFGFLKPIYAALSMAFSDVIVIGNSIRLKTKK